ncbi:hypothetical protein [Actinoalloteichus hymeniacidonis]|uniref:hypothetical protein n=1 Tax=Actinoalloteichus hymeniacidonis TaxID=340345 RepID=UPI0012FA80AB|nr:hypothetical protein [Actinoalloteichus hymeniacidonis]MBB5909383.1 hypothetical protein [Actinoalloteichus hymeniacidonis]
MIGWRAVRVRGRRGAAAVSDRTARVRIRLLSRHRRAVSGLPWAAQADPARFLRWQRSHDRGRHLAGAHRHRAEVSPVALDAGL